jgi:hypothetical protein
MLIVKSDFGNIEMLGTSLVCGEGEGLRRRSAVWQNFLVRGLRCLLVIMYRAKVTAAVDGEMIQRAAVTSATHLRLFLEFRQCRHCFCDVGHLRSYFLAYFLRYAEPMAEV